MPSFSDCIELRGYFLTLVFLLFFTNAVNAQGFSEVFAGSLTGVYASSVAWGDYDNDNDLDILLTGRTTAGEYISKIYQNTGTGFSEVFTASLTGVAFSSIAWGDYDNDGDVDIILTGNDFMNTISQIYENTGNDFTPAFFDQLTGVRNSSVAWGDYDNDGDLDLLLTGANAIDNFVSDIYQNRGNNFTKVFVGSLTGASNGSSAWGDYDNDGDLDLLITGSTNAVKISKIYNNYGTGFAEVYMGNLSGVISGSVAWGDCDSDGDLDILLSGRDSNLIPVSKIYENSGNGFYEIFAGSLPGVHFSSTAWGDYDNDGDLDILLTGFDGNNNPISKIYQNNRGGYTEVYVGSLTGVSYSSVAWGDYDNDSDLDILLTGLTSGGIAVSKIYKNNGVSINTAPAPPFGLSSTIIGSSVTLRWLKSTDTETPSSGLHYNIRLGTSSNAINTQSPMADVGNGFRRVVQLGNANQDTFWTIKNLSSGAYYWSVQAVDNAFTGSQFATEGNFMINANTTYHITTFFGINGTISPSGMVSIDSGANQIFSISPNSGYHIDSLIVDGVRVSSVPSYTFTNVTANHTIRAVFAINSYTITVASSANGTIFPGTSNVNYGDSVVYTISPNACYNVASVVIDGEVNAGAVSSYTFRNVTANHGITATFSTKQYTIVATAGENGSISPNGNVTVNCNGSQIFTVAPDPNYKIDSVIVDNGYSGRDSSYIFSNVKTNHFIRVSFRVINNYPVAVSLSDSIEKNRSKTITLIGEDPEGGRVTFFLDTQPMNGIIRDFNSSTGEVFYRTNHLFVGLDSFSFYCRDSLNAVSNIAWCIITVYAKSDSTTFRTFSQSDLKTAPVKKPKKGVRPMPTTGNVLDTLFVTGPFKKLKVKTDPKFPGGMVLGISQAVKDSAKKYGWIRHIGKSKDVQKSLTQFGSARGFDRFGNNRAFTKELKNPKTDNYSNQLAGELFALKVNIAASAKNITPSGFGNLVYDNPQQNPDTFVTKRLKIQGKTLAQISSEIDTLLTYYKRYYTGTTPSEEYSKITTAIIAVNEAFRSPIDTIGWSPLQLTSDVRIDGVEFLRRGSGGERLFRQREFTSSVPENILLLQNYPNPFNPATTLSFVISQSSSITLKIYDVLGQEVTMIIDNEVMDEGVYEVIFEAGDIPSGIYFTRLQAGTFLKTHKMILMK